MVIWGKEKDLKLREHQVQNMLNGGAVTVVFLWFVSKSETLSSGSVDHEGRMVQNNSWNIPS